MDTQGTDSGRNIERRRFLKHTATVAFAAPVMASMMSGAASAQVGQCGTKSGGIDEVDCTVTTPCETGMECRAAPLLPMGTPCGCVPI
jgi:hypothetical protein